MEEPVEVTTVLVRKRRRFGLRGLMAVVALLAILFAWMARDTRTPFEKLRGEWTRSEHAFIEAMDRAKTDEARREVSARERPKPVTFADRCLEMARATPDTPSALAALCWAATNAPSSKAGREAIEILKGGRIERADPSDLMQALESSRSSTEVQPNPLTSVVLDVARRRLDHPKAAGLLTWVAARSFNDRSDEVPATFAEAAELIVDRFPASPDISNFCETLGIGTGSPPWAGKYETHLRTVLAKNKTPLVRCTASFALASVVQAAGEARQEEAEALYNQFLKDFAVPDPSIQHVASNFLHNARAEAAGIRNRGLGKPAPAMVGLDLDGRPMSLADYRGKVVLVSFWATWCGPCMRMIPHERALLEKFKDRPFAIIGVNGDRDPKTLRKVLAETDIPWRSFRDSREHLETISEEWKVGGWPTFYLIDREGVVRKRWVGGPDDDVLDREIGLLLEAKTPEK